jgi:hypothetical protein
MFPMTDLDEFAALYHETLARWVDSGHEYQLEAAYAMGRQAFAEGRTILEFLDLHRGAVEALMEKPWPYSESERVRETFSFLAEALATFEMAQRGYFEAQARARFERVQAALREQLNQAYLAVDREVDMKSRLAAIEAVAVKLVDAKGARCVLLDGVQEIQPNHLVFSIRDPRGEKLALLDVDLTDRRPLTDSDRYLLNEFSRMAGVALENARLFERERSTALMLQHILLPAAMPQIDGLDLAMRYLPGEADSHAGGDWYDVFAFDDGQVGLVVGDVTGHGVSAAAAMGQLRIAVLAYALAGNPPADVIDRVDKLLVRLGTGEIATMVYLVIDPSDGQLALVNAGHPPPILIDPLGLAQPVRGGHGRLLGVDEVERKPRNFDVAKLHIGGHLLLYTDGLIEPLERTERDGVAELCAIADGFTGTADELCDFVLAEMAPDGANDDICVVAARLAD